MCECVCEPFISFNITGMYEFQLYIYCFNLFIYYNIGRLSFINDKETDLKSIYNYIVSKFWMKDGGKLSMHGNV